ncbi:MAG: leucyl/phenylalanyl-tRNA--protein transferase [Spirochaetales bacterium]|nr:leucyl/phenylalanyl-tRNA--protein transferase [Spirochaetales bacterium]
MPIFPVGKDIVFPPVQLATKEGIIAVGGDLSVPRLLSAYKQGIFPWYSPPDPILWWSPDPRMIMFPHEARVSKSMEKIIKKNVFSFSCDQNFKEVMLGCRCPRKEGPETWISDEILEAYCRLHELGYAHSVEVWHKDELAGGLYGVSLGSIFIGESMFYKVSNASKAAFIIFARRLAELGFTLIDCQVYTPHLASLGAWTIPRHQYLKLLRQCLQHNDRRGSWKNIFDN